MDGYLCEIAGFREVHVGATDVTSYPYFLLYWSEQDRFPFTIWSEGKLAGFAFVRCVRDLGTETMQIAEFYIVPEKRRQGIGSAAAEALWRSFPGKWELQVHIRNKEATKFWSRCIGENSVQDRVEEISDDDGRRLFFNFSVE